MRGRQVGPVGGEVVGSLLSGALDDRARQQPRVDLDDEWPCGRARWPRHAGPCRYRRLRPSCGRRPRWLAASGRGSRTGRDYGRCGCVPTRRGVHRRWPMGSPVGRVVMLEPRVRSGPIPWNLMMPGRLSPVRVRPRDWHNSWSRFHAPRDSGGRVSIQHLSPVDATQDAQFAHALIAAGVHTRAMAEDGRPAPEPRVALLHGCRSTIGSVALLSGCRASRTTSAARACSSAPMPRACPSREQSWSWCWTRRCRARSGDRTWSTPGAPSCA